MRYLNYIIINILFSLIIGCNDNEKDNLPKMRTVDYVDLKRFMGDWFVIANIPTFIEKNATNAVESYSMGDNGEVKTNFTFFQNYPHGKKKVYKPTGYIHNTDTNAEWRMQFLWPFKMPFLIIDLDKQYQYTVIGYPNRKYLWIMSRNPEMDSNLYNSIIDQLSKKGFDISKIKKVTQIWD